MNGFVLELIPDDENLPTVYWTENGSGLENLNEAFLYTDITTARMEAGRIQSIYTGYSIRALPASKGIILLKPTLAHNTSGVSIQTNT